MLLLMNYQVEEQFTLGLQLIFGLDGANAHQHGFMRFGAIRLNWQSFNEIGTKSF
jgi:hypothetical protein